MRPDRSRFVCTDLRVARLSRSVRFYSLLGLRPLARYRMDDGTRIAWMRDAATGQVLELFQFTRASPLYSPFRPSTEANRALIFTCPVVEPLVRCLRRAGASVVLGFVEGGIRLVFLRDPDGAWVELAGWADPPAHRGRPLPLRCLVQAQQARPPVDAGRPPREGGRPWRACAASGIGAREPDATGSGVGVPSRSSPCRE